MRGGIVVASLLPLAGDKKNFSLKQEYSSVISIEVHENFIYRDGRILYKVGNLEIE